MKKPTKEIDRVIYLLHFSPPIGKAVHYLGISRRDMLATRLRQHARGYGASLTYRARELGASIYHVLTIPDATFELEKKLKLNGHFRDLCPMCDDPTSEPTPTRLSVRPTTNTRKEQVELLAWSPKTPASPRHADYDSALPLSPNTPK